MLKILRSFTNWSMLFLLQNITFIKKPSKIAVRISCDFQQWHLDYETSNRGSLNQDMWFFGMGHHVRVIMGATSFSNDRSEVLACFLWHSLHAAKAKAKTGGRRQTLMSGKVAVAAQRDSGISALAFPIFPRQRGKR